MTSKGRAGLALSAADVKQLTLHLEGDLFAIKQELTEVIRSEPDVFLKYRFERTRAQHRSDVKKMVPRVYREDNHSFPRNVA